MWLDGRSPHTQRAYGADIARLARHTGKQLQDVGLRDLQSWVATLSAMSPASRARKIGAAKSLLGFGHRIGYLPFNVGAALRAPPVKGTL